MKISDLAFLSDCQSSALVGRDGSVEWYCIPRFDSPSVFGRLLDPQAGHWQLRPVGDFSSSRRYVGESLVLETRFSTASGTVSLRDALALEPGSRGHEIGRSVPHALLRSVRGLEGEVEMEMEFCPRFEYGLTHPRYIPSDHGVKVAGGPVEMELASPVPLENVWEATRARFSVKAGESRGFCLSYRPTFSDEQMARLPVDETIEETARSWESWGAQHQGYQETHRSQVRFSAMVLQGLTYQPSGAVIAAATTSLPETLGGSDNWDYRFAWLRDASLMMRALWVAACPDEPERFFDWISKAGGHLDREAVQIMYGIEGERDLTEHFLDHMQGFAGSRPVRIGNDAWKQKQLDVLGEVLDAAHLLRERLGGINDATRSMLVSFADRAASNWMEPDAGMWEARDQERHYLSSKVMCWVALDRAVKLAEQLGAEERRPAWEKAAAESRAAIIQQGWNPEIRAFTGAFGSSHLDASVLLMPLMGFIPATDERMRSTIDVIDRELCERGLVRRWQEETSGFIICSYWLVECLALAGEVDRAREKFDQVTACANDLGLMSEEADPVTGELLGNFPQAFSHVGLINAAWQLSQAENSGA